MKRLTKLDREWFIKYLKNQIKEEEFYAWRYKTEETYEQVTKLKRIFNILNRED